MTAFWNDLTWNQRIGYTFGAVYVLVGAVGFAVTSGVGFAETQGNALILFDLNPLHNIVHLAVGAVLLLTARAGAAQSRLMNGLVGGTYLVVGVAGLFLVSGGAHPTAANFPSVLDAGGNAANILALNHPDNALHLASAIVLLGVALLVKDRAATEEAAAEGVDDSDEAEQTAETDEQSSEEPTPDEQLAADDEHEAEVIELPSGAKLPGDDVTVTGTYTCVCDEFEVRVKKGLFFPYCPGGDDPDHYYMRKPRSSKSGAKRSA